MKQGLDALCVSLFFDVQIRSKYKGMGKKKWIFYGLTDSKRLLHPPPLQSVFCEFFLVCFLSEIMILCILKGILHKKKSIFMQLLEPPIPPLTAAHLIVGEYL